MKTEIVRDVITKTVQQVLENAPGNQKVSVEAANQTGPQMQDQQHHGQYPFLNFGLQKNKCFKEAENALIVMKKKIENM